MSQCNPREDNGYEKQAKALNGAEATAEHPNRDTTDSNQLAYPVEPPQPVSQDQNVIARYQQVKPSSPVLRTVP